VGSVILLCGGTGDVGGRIAARLCEHGASVRALVRPTSNASALEGLGIAVVRGDLTDPGSLVPAVAGVETVVTTANAISRLLSGDRTVSIEAVDRAGNAALVRAAEDAGVQRFVFVSVAMVDAAAPLAPFAAAKAATESLLRASAMHEVLVRPDKFQEVWLSPRTGLNPAAGLAVIYGRGQVPERYVAEDDVAELVVRLALEPDPPRVVEFGGPEAMTRLEVVTAMEQATGRHMRRVHVPRAMLAMGARLLRPAKPELASMMGMALAADRSAASWDDAPLRERGIPARPVSDAIAAMVAVG
jgi:NADH dehydrogenase